MSTAPVEFSYEFTPELSRAATRRLFQHLFGWRVPLGLLAYGALCALLLWMGASILAAIFTGAWLVLVVAVVAGYVTRIRRNAALLRRMEDRTGRCRIAGDGVELINALGHSTFRWSLIGKVVRYPDVWLFFIETQPFWLPAAQLQSEAGERLVEMASRAGATIV